MTERYTSQLIAVALVIATLAAFCGVLSNGFVDLDDEDYVLRNPHVRQGLTWESVVWSFTSFDHSNWHPLTWLSLELDSRLHGLNAAGYHATNLLLHLANTVLLFCLLRAATDRMARSAVVAALFALHPLHVESVAWVTERKDVLSTFFGFGALWAYTWYAARPSWKRYLFVATCFALSLLAKAMFVTFPFLALLWDYWPLARLSRRIGADTRRPTWLVLEKLPLFALSLASCMATFAAQRAGESVASVEHLPVTQRVVNLSLAYVAYAGKIFWPTNLTAFYPLPEKPPAVWQPIAALVILLSVTALVVALARRLPYLATGWFWFVGTLVPVIGLTQIGTQSMADCYTYVPTVGLFLAGVWAASDIAGYGGLRGRMAASLLTAAILCACAVLTWRQVRYWHDPAALWQHALDVSPNNYRAKAHLGQQCLQRGQFDEARRYATSSLSDRPNAFAHLVLGAIDFKDRKPGDAKAHYEQALALESTGWGAAWNGLGAVEAAEGDFGQAESSFRQSLSLDPYSPTAHNNLGLALLNLGQFSEAAKWFEGAVRLDPSFTAANENLAVAHAADESWAEALAACAALVDHDPNEPRGRRLLASVLWELKDIDEGMRQYKVADRLDQGWQQRLSEEAQQLLDTSPDNPYSLRKALLFAKQVCEASHPAPTAADLALLARAYAASGLSDKASSTAGRALRAAEAAGDKELAAKIRLHLKEVPSAKER